MPKTRVCALLCGQSNEIKRQPGSVVMSIGGVRSEYAAKLRMNRDWRSGYWQTKPALLFDAVRLGEATSRSKHGVYELGM